MLKELNFENFDDEVKDGIKLVEFYTKWCGYCKKQKPELEQMEKIWIGLIDAEENLKVSSKYNVNTFPTFLIFKDGKEAERFSGFKTKEDLMSRIMNQL